MKRHGIGPESQYGPPEDEAVYILWYYPDINRFVDEDGHVFHDEIQEIFPTWFLHQYIHNGDGYELVRGKDGQLYELWYQEPNGYWNVEDDAYYRYIWNLR